MIMCLMTKIIFNFQLSILAKADLRFNYKSSPLATSSAIGLPFRTLTIANAK